MYDRILAHPLVIFLPFLLALIYAVVFGTCSKVYFRKMLYFPALYVVVGGVIFVIYNAHKFDGISIFASALFGALLSGALLACVCTYGLLVGLSADFRLSGNYLQNHHPFLPLAGVGIITVAELLVWYQSLIRWSMVEPAFSWSVFLDGALIGFITGHGFALFQIGKNLQLQQK